MDRKLKILITGGNGYLAKKFFNKFKNQYDFTIVTRRDFCLNNYTETCKWFKNRFFDVVIHTAIVGGNRLKPESSDTLDQNLLMFYNLLANKNHYKRFINFGSGAEFAKQTPYGLSKAVIAESMQNKNDFYNLRIFAVFDEDEDDRRFIKKNLIQYKNKEPIIIHQNKKMDFMYMEDFLNVVQYYVHNTILLKSFDCTYNTSYFLTEIANIINQLDNYAVEVIIEDNNFGENFIGTYNSLIPYVGIEKGIKNVFTKLSS